jgi:hypothetical protein
MRDVQGSGTPSRPANPPSPYLPKALDMIALLSASHSACAAANAAAFDLAETIEGLTPRVVRSDVALLLGPWLRGYGIGFEQEGRIDDAPGYSGTLVGPEGTPGTWSEPGVLADPASRGTTFVIGIEAGLARFLALDVEAVSKLGRAYLLGSIDFVKARAEVFGTVTQKWPDLGPDNWADGGYLGDFDFRIGLRVGAQVLFELIGAHYEIGYDTPPIPMHSGSDSLQLTARLDAAVHAFARAYAEVCVGTRCAFLIGGKAFAGASTTVTGQAELASLGGAQGSLTAWVGVGAEYTCGGEFDLKTLSGEWTQSGGVAMGYGVSYDYGVTVNGGEIIAASGLSPLAEIALQWGARVAASAGSTLALETSPSEFGDEVKAASNDAVSATTEFAGLA